MTPSLDRNPDLAVAATYHRTLTASLEHVWENVFDWEHLPWLHATTFRAVERVADGGWGWRVRVGLARGGDAEIELVADRAAGRYVARTLSGVGAGTEIWTRLATDVEGAVAVSIDFCVGPLPNPVREAIGRGYVEMYTRLWNEDEGMIRQRQSALLRRRASGKPTDAGRVEISLGAEADLRLRLPFVFELGTERFALVEEHGELVARAAECPHRMGPLAPCADAAGTLVCPWHGYRFDARNGRELTGRRLRLARAPRISRDPATGRITACTASPAESSPSARRRGVEER